MKDFYKRLNSGWTRLLHVILSVFFGVLGLGIYHDFVSPDGYIIGFFLGIIIYQPIAAIFLWVIDGFKSKNKTPKLGAEKREEILINEEQTKTSIQKDVNPKVNQGVIRRIAFKWLLPVLIFFVLYFPLYWVFVFNTRTEALTPVCVLVSFGLSRYLGKQIKRKFY